MPHLLYDPPRAPAWPLRLAEIAGVCLFWAALVNWLFS